ncbi:MAG: hypothetical protein PF549_04395 [Patescibacteria group bacterium]|jgi:hypothetical protein|nr:hypothetical protein [Patescibacteria group bacterium]
MTNTQFFIISKIVKWCDDNLEKMKREGKVFEEISSACINFITQKKDSEVVRPSVIREYIEIRMS